MYQTLSYVSKLSSMGSTSVVGMYQTLSSGSKLSSCSKYWLGPDVYDIRISYVSRQCTSFDGDNVAPYLLRRLAAPFLLRGLATPYLLKRLAAPYLLRILATPYLLRRLAAPYLLRRLVTPYLLRRHYSLVITSGPKVAFVTPAIPVDRSDME
ncbi:hypothetical protein Tco_0613913 [Tanacetum coccineum]